MIIIRITNKVKTTWNGNNKKWYIEKGYIFTKLGDELEVKVEDLMTNSIVLIECLCDYCLKDGIETKIIKPFGKYNRDVLNSVTKKDACKRHKQEKYKETIMELYGVDHVMKIESIKDKSKQSNLKNHGGVYHTKTKEYLQKRTETNLLKYGVINVSQIQEIKDKKKKTTLKNFGVEYPMQSDIVMTKSRKTLYKNNSVPTSKQQKYLCNLFNGILNYPVGRSSLDMAFIEEKIYIEYDGKGHNLAVKMNEISEKEFQEQHKKREMFIKSKGWKLIRIVSENDKLPLDNILLKIFSYAKRYLKSGHTWIEFDINKNKISNKLGESFYNFGELRKIFNNVINK